MELANMDLEGGEHLIGEGPENQQTCVKWVKFSAEIAHQTSKQITNLLNCRHDQIHRQSILLWIIWCSNKSMSRII